MKTMNFINPEDTRSESMTFELMINRCLDRLHIQALQKTASNDWKEWSALETGVRFLCSYIKAFYKNFPNQEEFEKKLKEILNELKELRNKLSVHKKEYAYIEKLTDLLDIVIERYGVASSSAVVRETISMKR